MMWVSAACHMEISNGQAFAGINENQLKVKRCASCVLALKKPVEITKRKNIYIYFNIFRVINRNHSAKI